MIDRDHALPVTQQARLVGISRSSAYYQSRGVSEADLKLMRRIDELHLEHPFAGARMLARLLRREGIKVGRKHVGILCSLERTPWFCSVLQKRPALIDISLSLAR